MVNCQACSVCGVPITNQDEVLFTYGKPGTRAKLYARVCQYVNTKEKDYCLNKDFTGSVTQSDIWHSEIF